MSNGALGPLLDGVADELLVPPANCMRVALHPDGLAPRIINLGDWRGHLLHRLAREIRLTGDPELEELYHELLGYPGPVSDDAPDASAVMVELQLDNGLRFISTVTTFGTGRDVTISELSIEAFFPADPQMADRLRAAGSPSAAARGGLQRRVLPAAVGGVEVRPRRDDLVDPVEHVVGRAATSAAPQLGLELLHRPRADDRRGHRRVADDERERQLDQRDPGLLGELARARRRPRACAGWPGSDMS